VAALGRGVGVGGVGVGGVGVGGVDLSLRYDRTK